MKNKLSKKKKVRHLRDALLGRSVLWLRSLIWVAKINLYCSTVWVNKHVFILFSWAHKLPFA